MCSVFFFPTLLNVFGASISLPKAGGDHKPDLAIAEQGFVIS